MAAAATGWKSSKQQRRRCSSVSGEFRAPRVDADNWQRLGGIVRPDHNVFNVIVDKFPPDFLDLQQRIESGIEKPFFPKSRYESYIYTYIYNIY